MTITRIYQSISMSPHTTILLDEKASHHLARVLRANVGDALIMFNGQGGEYAATITEIGKKSVRVELQAFNAREAESPVQIHLAQGIARGEKMDFIVQKAVELGVTNIIPLITERCNVRLDNEREEKRLQHWQAVAVSACEQSGRNRVPMISPPQNLSSWLPQAHNAICFVLSPQAVARNKREAFTPGTIVLLVGPEGGLSEQEIALAVKNNFLPWNLGPRVLRTETAGIAAISVLQYLFGDFA